jgi:hypothetical protein
MSDMTEEIKKNASPEAGQKPQEAGDEAVLLSPQARLVCPADISTLRLRTFLFNLKDGLEVDPLVSDHVAKGCVVCDSRRKLMYATIPYLQDKLPQRFLAREEMPLRPKRLQGQQGSTSAANPAQSETSMEASAGSGLSVPGDLKSLRAEVTRKLASLVASPAEPLSLTFLQEMAESVVVAIDAEERSEVAQKIMRICDARWRRLASELQSAVEGVAEQLLTILTGAHRKAKAARAATPLKSLSASNTPSYA